MKNKTKCILKGIVGVIVLVLIDQLTKLLAVKNLMGQADIHIIPGVLQLHYLENTGAAFSLLQQQMWLFYILTPILVMAIICFFLRTPVNNTRFVPLRILLVVLCAGALGNYMDRIFHGYVIDFIYFSLIDFPIFNVADIYVTCCVFLLFILILFYYREDELEELISRKKPGMEK